MGAMRGCLTMMATAPASLCRYAKKPDGALSCRASGIEDDSPGLPASSQNLARPYDSMYAREALQGGLGLILEHGLGEAVMATLSIRVITRLLGSHDGGQQGSELSGWCYLQ